MRTLQLSALFLICLSCSLTAQIDDLVKNPDISYIATFETEHDFRLSSKRQASKLQLLKFSYPTDGCANFSDNWLAQWLLKGMTEGKFKAYHDAELSIWVAQSTLLNRITSIDTVITFDPNSYEERVQVIRNDINADDIVAFRTHQAIYYDKKSGNYGTRLLAIAPLVRQTGPTGQVIGTIPLAWLAMDGKLPSGFSAQSSDVSWTVLLLDNANFLEISKLKIKKNELKQGFAEHLFKEAMNPKHRVESSKAYGCGEPLTPNYIKRQLAEIDTIITFDPETSEETMQVVKNEFRPTDVKQVLLAQEWYYDSRRKVVLNRLKAIAPQMDITNVNGEFMYTRQLFYIYFEDGQ